DLYHLQTIQVSKRAESVNMQFKLIVTMVQDDKVDKVLEAAREAGATGATVITNARGEGRQPLKTFFGLELTIQRDMVLLVVEDSMSRRILETISEVAELDETQAPASPCRSPLKMPSVSRHKSNNSQKK